MKGIGISAGIITEGDSRETKWLKWGWCREFLDDVHGARLHWPVQVLLATWSYGVLKCG